MLNFILYQIGQRLAVILPLWFSYGLAVFLADLHRLFSAVDRAAVRDNLKVVLPGADDKLIKVYSKEAFRNFAKYLVDFLRFERIDKNYIQEKVSIEGLDIVDKALSNGSGVIVVTAHIGNWELAGITMAILGYPIVCVALTHRNIRINDFFTKQRERKGLGVIPLGNAAFRCICALKNNKMLALVGDRDFTQAGISIDLFGRPTIIPKGPAAFSLKTNASLVVGIMLREKKGRFKFKYEGPVEIIPSGDEEKDIRELTKKYLDILEKYIRLCPEQWLIFRRFWEPVDMNACD